MKKLIMLVCVTALILAMGTTAFAAEGDTTTTATKTANMQQKLADRKIIKDQKKLDIQAFRAVQMEKRNIVKANRDSNVAIRTENKTLRVTIASSLKAMKESGATLDPAISEQLKAYKAVLKTATATLKSTKGAIKVIMTANKANVKTLNYTAMEAAFTQVADIQVARKVQLTQINDTLKAMVTLLK